MLKYENIAEIGDVIKAFDFQPMEGRGDRYVEGVVLSKTEHNGAAVYMIRVTVDSAEHGEWTRVGEQVFVPFETTFDFDGRVELIA